MKTTLGGEDFRHSKRETQRSERFGSPLWQGQIERVRKKRGSKSDVALRYTRVWNDVVSESTPIGSTMLLNVNKSL